MCATRKASIGFVFFWIGSSTLSLMLGATTAWSDDTAPNYGIYVASSDAGVRDSLKEILAAGEAESTVATFESLERAVASSAEVLVIALPRSRDPYSDDLIEGLKKKKVIGIGYGAAQLFGQLELEINGGACAHFGAMPDIVGVESDLLEKSWESRKISPYAEPTPGDDFGMYIPRLSEQVYFVDVIARVERDENYAPIVKQNNYVMIGISGTPSAWTDELRALVAGVASELLQREQKPFAKAEYPRLLPGKHVFGLGKGRSTEELFSKTYYFKFTRPTIFTATLLHTDSQAMMLLFMSQKGRLHWTRQDAKEGEPLTIVCEITAADIEKIGEGLWELKVTNFDRNNRSACVLDVRYDLGP